MTASALIARTTDPARRPGRFPFPGGIALAIAAIVGVGWLLWPTPPGRAVMHTGTSHYIATATVDSPRIGATGIDIDLTDRNGGPVDRAMVRVEAIMPLMGYASPSVTAAAAGAGHYRAAAVDLMMTGPWELQVSIDAPDGADELTLPLQVSG